MRNCACGYFAPSIAMNGIVPPSPIHIAGLPKCFLEDSSMAASSHFSVGGACQPVAADRKSTRLNSSHSQISYAVFCLKKKKNLRTHYEVKDCDHLFHVTQRRGYSLTQ